MNVKTLSSQVSNVSSGTSVEEGLLVVRVFPWSHNSSVVDSEMGTFLVGEGKSSVRGSSDGLGS